MSLFHKKLTLVSVVDGQASALSKLSDAAFREGMLGPGIAIQPSPAPEVTVYAPCPALISHISESRHAVVLTCDNQAEILIHIGLDTVKLKGEGFRSWVQEGMRVEAGAPLITFEEEKIRENGFDTVIPVVVCNAEPFKEIKTEGEGPVVHGKNIILTIVC